jgi:hypothetical protein
VTGKLINTETDHIYYKIKGKWSGTTTVTDTKGNEQILFDKPLYPPPKVIVKPEEEQEEFESRRYLKLTDYGQKSLKPSKNKIMKLQPMKKIRLRIIKELL